MAALRSDARADDHIFVSGSPGRAAIVLQKLIDGAPLSENERAPWVRPVPRLALAQRLAKSGQLTAAIDLSDGLGMDLARLLRASGLGAVIDLGPLEEQSGIDIETVLQGGEDYELLFCMVSNPLPLTN